MQTLEGPLFSERPGVDDLVAYLNENGIPTMVAHFKGAGQCGRLEHGDLIINLYTKGTALLQGHGTKSKVATVTTLLSAALWNVKCSAKVRA